VYRHWVYVLNAGDQGTVQGYWLGGDDHLSRMRFSHRSLGLGNTNPPDYLHSPGQVGFTPDGHKLRHDQGLDQLDRRLLGRSSRRAEQVRGVHHLGDTGALCLRL